MDNKVIMPKATALWLKINTKLSANQIAEFCEIDLLTLDSLNINTIIPHNPIKSKQITEEEIQIAEANINHKLKSFLNIDDILPPKTQRKYISLAFRKQKPQIVAWFYFKLEEYQRNNELLIKKIARTISTNSNFIKKVFEEIKNDPDVFKNSTVDPFFLGICSMSEINKILDKN